MGAYFQRRTRLRLIVQATPLSLPVVLPFFPGEILSSWITRHANFYSVSPQLMLRHCLPEAKSLRAVDMDLSNDHEARLECIFSTEAKHIQRMTFTNIHAAFRHLVAPKPFNHCNGCSARHHGAGTVLRSQLLRWRITCQSCGAPLQDGFALGGSYELRSPFQRYEAFALHGQKLLDDEIERGLTTWTSPTGIAGLLLMRRYPDALFYRGKQWLFRILGAIIPELDDVCQHEPIRPPTPCYPVLPLHFRRVWLAGIAIVEQAGPAMLKILRQKVMDDYCLLSNEIDRDDRTVSIRRTKLQFI